jgi:hypothetical protein
LPVKIALSSPLFLCLAKFKLALFFLPHALKKHSPWHQEQDSAKANAIVFALLLSAILINVDLRNVVVPSPGKDID